MIYVASPYSDPDPLCREHRYQKVRDYTIEMIRAGAVAFSPIMYLHKAAIDHDLPKDAAFWHKFNINMLRISDGVLVLCLYGWQQSTGVQSEISSAEHLNIPIIYVIEP